MNSTTLSQNERRSIPPAVAGVVAELEMFRAHVVTGAEIASMIGVEQGSDKLKKVIQTLVSHGWLLPLSLRGTYEFLPAHAGPDRAGNPLTEAMAALKRTPGLRVQAVLWGAAFVGGFADRAPTRYTLIVPEEAPIQNGLAKVYDVIRVAPSRFFGSALRDGVPVSGAERLLFDAALWPDRAGDLRDSDHWLRASLSKSDVSTIVAFAGRLDSARVTARAGYFAESFGRPDVASALAALRPQGTVHIGDPADPPIVRDARFGVTDHIGIARL